jgi:uncharacterized damage-inducible protein DinB
MSTQLNASLILELNGIKEYFDRSTRVLDEDDSEFTPQAGLMTVAQQVAHVAQTIDWFVEGATRPEGFDMNFEQHMKVVEKITSLKAAREWLEKSHKHIIDTIGGMSDAELFTPLPKDGIMGGAPKLAIVSALNDHTAHHRGALTVYTRQLGKVPAMPYMDM